MGMDPRVAENRRVYLTVAPDGPGRFCLKLSLHPPKVGADPVALISRGTLVDDQDVCLSIVSDPTQVPELRGKPGDPGASAYQIARDAGYGGTLTQWLASLVGAAGQSAYQLARAEGYGGTLAQWLASLKGADGKNASTFLGTISIAQTATIQIAAGVRRVLVTIPASMGVAAGDALTACPTAALAGYAVHDVVAVSSTQLSIGLTGPLLAIGASFTIPAKLFRLTA